MTLKIDFKPGSDFQLRSGGGSIKGMIMSWKSYYEAQHKKNVIKVEIEGEHVEEY